MRVFIAVLVLIFSLQSWTKADDIRDFEIEGMSIGDSLLDFYSESEIKKSLKSDVTYFYKNNKFADIFFESNGIYQWLQISIKPKDKKYKIYAMNGQIHYKKNIKDCYKKKDEIVKDIAATFSDEIKVQDNGKSKHRADKTGKSTYTSYAFFPGYPKDDLSNISIQCFDWSEKLPYADKLIVSFKSKEFANFILNEAYK